MTPNASRPVVALVLTVLAAGCGSSSPPSAGNARSSASAMAGTSPASAQPAPSDPTKSSTSAAPNTPAAVAKGTYVDYATYRSSVATYAGTKVVLFFHATWCSECKHVDESLTSAAVPAGLTVVKVDYDTEADLRQKYGVTIQHTFVQIDPMGKQLAKWSTATEAVEILAKTV